MFDLDVARPETEVTLMRRVAMITGASRGIGAATALVLAERGFRVVVNHRASAPQADVTFPLGQAAAIRLWVRWSAGDKHELGQHPTPR
jgi:NAD(P)-dependent dehydrogenase (short-subunit alcohol dehydrogenase family)